MLAFLLVITDVVAQNNRSNGSRPNLELTDAEVNQYWLRARALGYSLQQIPDLAKSQGFSDNHAQQLYRRIVRLERIASVSGNTGNFSYGVNQDSLATHQLKNRIFGMDVFNRAFLTSFSPDVTIATPETYVIGPGDLLSIVVYGTSQEYYSLEVTPQGTVVLPVLGPVSLSGLNIKAAKELLRARLSTIYAGLRGPNPSVSVDITLEQIRSIRINIVGEVERPGAYEVPSYSSVFNALYSAGGLTVNGTFRKVKVLRGGKVVSEIDLYKFLIFGESPSTQTLADDDIILVNPIETRIEIKGEVRRSGLFEVIEGENLGQLLKYAGGFTAEANRKNLLVERYNGLDQFARDYPVNPTWVFDFNDGDALTIRKSTSLDINRVQIEGAVQAPGIYQWVEGLTIDSLVSKAGGVLPNAFRKNITVFRFNQDFTSSALHINLDKDRNFELRKGDVVKIVTSLEVTETRFLQVSGEVNEPGIFPYYQGITVGDVLILSGGFKNSALNGVIEIARRTYENGVPTFQTIQINAPRSIRETDFDSLSFELQPLDHLFVRPAAAYQEDALVTVVGEVNHPGDFVITSSEVRVTDILERSGGFTNYAFVEGVALLRVVSEENVDKRSLKAEIDRLEVLRSLLLDDEDIFINSNNAEDLRILEERIEQLRSEYEQQYLTTEEGVVDLLAIDADAGVSFSSQSSGLSRRERRDRIGIDVQNILSNPQSSDNFVLLPGDILEIPRKKETVRIRGRVQYTTSTKYEENRKFKDYISQAGGFELNAKRSLAYVIYANGDAKKTKNFLFFKKWPEVRPGSQIVVPAGRVRQVFNPERVIALTSSLLTTFLVIDNLTSN